MSDGSEETNAASDPPDTVVVETAAEAAENLVFSRLDREQVTDLDITVRYEEGILEVEVYLDAPDAEARPSEVADDAALAARAAVDELLE